MSSHYVGIEVLDLMSYAKNYNAFIKNLIRNLIESGPANIIVDFGAGKGEFLPEKRGDQKICAIEPDEVLSKKISDRVEVRELEEFEDCSIDCLYSINVLEHINNDVEVLEKIFSKTKEDGRLLLYVPAFNFLWTELDGAVGHCRRYTKKKLERKLKKAGFNVTKIFYNDSLGFISILLHKIFFKKLSLSRNKVVFFDKYIFTISVLLDSILFRYLFGKNIYVYAKKSNSMKKK